MIHVTLGKVKYHPGQLGYIYEWGVIYLTFLIDNVNYYRYVLIDIFLTFFNAKIIICN